MNASSESLIDSLPFRIDAYGRFPPGQVRIRVESTPRPTTPEIESLIAHEWERRTSAARATGGLLFNGDMLRYLRHRVLSAAGSDVFELTVGPTCYRDFVGTNLYNHDRIDELGSECFANPIGTTATLMTSDGRICYGRRSDRVAYHAGHVHTFGGAYEAADVGPDGEIEPFSSVRRELQEELGLVADELRDLFCVGLIRDREIYQPEMLFEARLDMTVDDLVRHWETAEAREEHQGIVWLPNEPDAIVPFLAKCGPIAPVAVGALLLHGRACWGERWFQQTGREISRQ